MEKTSDETLHIDMRITEYSVRRIHENCTENQDQYLLQITFENKLYPSRYKYLGIFNVVPDAPPIADFKILMDEINTIMIRRFEVYIVSKKYGKYLQLMLSDDINQYVDLYSSIWELNELPSHVVTHKRLCDEKCNHM